MIRIWLFTWTFYTKKQTRTAEKYLVNDHWKSAQYWRSQPNTGTNSQRFEQTKGERKIEFYRQRLIKKILEWFCWTDRLPTEAEKKAVEGFLVEYRDIFVRRRKALGMNRELKVKLTSKDDEAICSQNPPVPIQIIEELVVDLALMHFYGITTVLSFSKYASPNEKIRRKNSSPCGPQESWHSNCRWLHQ